MTATEPSTNKKVISHQWIVKPSTPDNNYWEERHCPVCGLHDQRRNIAEAPSAKWGVTTHCIIPPPEMVTYAELMREFKAHGVRERVLVIGVPGNWSVGFSIGRRGYQLYPNIQIKESVERGFAELLRWMRARKYNAYMYSDMSYASSLASDDCPCADDD